MPEAKSEYSFAATGIGVSDLKRSVDFYTRILGMTNMQTINLPHMDEVLLSYPGSPLVVLMHFTDGSNPHYRDNPVKLALQIPDMDAMVKKIRDGGYAITREPTLYEPLKMMIAMASDPDGYTIELMMPVKA
ncbi:MAG: VOC family protein [Alphaproteobacteria bacterium]|jgi:lactoylglutathione lyase|nr:VOC family protein [Alphaproteobacteria bacterium]OJU56959.1 MAG: hypothetical protein BGO00_03475 [Alphaproteobacteria bacterium 62-8]MBN9556838.1 VOC family protein [Alphaproteobacteria bacterium]MBN9569109.1 VOC family protein [Alphaproteobacteria bacterium]MBN9569517.1 VOC family protein [Alphaproteobacteria bacterium]